MTRTLAAIAAEAATRARPYLKAAGWTLALLAAGYNTASPILFWMAP